MPESRSHKIAANRIAKRLGTEYNSGEGVDILTPDVAVEVETADTVKDGIRQLRGFKKPVYIAGANKDAVEEALKATKGTTIGVMDNQGKILKPSSRKRR
ncbi:MAG: hypothetical protein JRH08_16680 [Deltaproteobacteria bacterium]|nr:hypothetical protein [Deltaproteobacteria bacterium]MBW1928073.1 hypothetical protein [Deltaproteobacteria bacterium]MBW2027179.1 hypothetical protein [Deltaproteobacteria bacterium]MBW2127251.1 hypothetical protein [Deltaproteobacteria bacterium]